MIHIAGLRLTSFLCFRGDHELELGPGVFAVTAERDSDPRRSNFTGKSSLLWAIRFALTGYHPKATEDEWITNGEPEGGVDLELSDGTFVSRTRVRGASTKLRVIVLDFHDPANPSERELLGDEAQAALDLIVGGDQADQLATWWCEQKKADRFLTSDSSTLTKDVVAWTDLERVQDACSSVANELRIKTGKRDAKLASLVHQEAELKAIYAQHAGPGTEGIVGLQIQLEAADAHVFELEQQIAANTGAAAAQAERERLQRGADEYSRWQRALALIERELTDCPEVDPKELKAKRDVYARANTMLGEVTADLKQKRALARGAFDGTCPVGGCPCPIKNELNKDTEKNGQAAIESAKAHETAKQHVEIARVAVEALDRRAVQRPAILKRKADAELELPRFRPLFEKFNKLERGEAATDNERLVASLKAARENLMKLQGQTTRSEELTNAIALAKAEAEQLVPDITAHREALMILGPAGAQRRVAEGMLEEVEDGANDMLTESGVELRVAIAWQRELKDLADACSGCGEPFPSSKKVKQCSTCGADRGNKLERKLRARVTPRSGGADDVGGVAIRLAANSWLRGRRESQWSIACLDEPFAALDQHNRHAVARHLAALLGGRYGVEQAFITAHDPGLLSGLPNRIVIRGTERGSTVEVL